MLRSIDNGQVATQPVASCSVGCAPASYDTGIELAPPRSAWSRSCGGEVGVHGFVISAPAASVASAADAAPSDQLVYHPLALRRSAKQKRSGRASQVRMSPRVDQEARLSRNILGILGALCTGDLRRQVPCPTQCEPATAECAGVVHVGGMVRGVDGRTDLSQVAVSP